MPSCCARGATGISTVSPASVGHALGGLGETRRRQVARRFVDEIARAGDGARRRGARAIAAAAASTTDGAAAAMTRVVERGGCGCARRSRYLSKR